MEAERDMHAMNRTLNPLPSSHNLHHNRDGWVMLRHMAYGCLDPARRACPPNITPSRKKKHANAPGPKYHMQHS
jgi:hypothetical protein